MISKKLNVKVPIMRMSTTDLKLFHNFLVADENFKSRAVNQGSISGKIPEKYLVVTDSQMLRLKYLLVYKEKTLPARTFWTYNNLALIFTVAYVLSLFCIGFFQGPTGAKIWRRLTRIFSSQD